VAFGASGDRLFAAVSGGELLAFDLTDSTPTPLAELTGTVKGMAARPVAGGTELVVAVDDHGIRRPPAHVFRRWTVSVDGRVRSPVAAPLETGPVTFLGAGPPESGWFVAAERVSVIATDRGPLQRTALFVRWFACWEAVPAAAEVPPSGHWVHAVAASPNRRLLAALTAPRVDVLDLTTPRAGPVAVLKGRRGAHVHGVAFDPTGRRLAVAGNDRAVTVYDTSTWAIAESFDWGLGPLRGVAFSPDGTQAAAGSVTGTVVVWDVE
jgi:hypothetical protein